MAQGAEQERPSRRGAERRQQAVVSASCVHGAAGVEPHRGHLHLPLVRGELQEKHIQCCHGHTSGGFCWFVCLFLTILILTRKTAKKPSFFQAM